MTTVNANSFASFHVSNGVFAVLFVILFIAGASLIKEPNRRNFMAIMIGGAGAAYLSGGGFGRWEVVFTAVVTYCAYRGLRSYNFIGLGWILHTIWDLAHHFYGHPILPFVPNSSAGCAISDALLAIWFFAGAPSIFDWKRSVAAR
ncbi:MAG TPA: DUF6010 family protein [Bryobacteraceae bacterium]|nr:DUF6010 family protein [Bryobacteraceae bacterium]